MVGIDDCPCCSEIGNYFPETYKTWSVNDVSLIPLVNDAFYKWTCKTMNSYYSATPQHYHMMFDWDNEFAKYWEYAIGIYFHDLNNFNNKYNGAFIVLHPALYNTEALKSTVLHEIGHSLGLAHMLPGLDAVMAIHRKNMFDSPTKNDLYIYSKLALVNKQRRGQVVKITDAVFDQF